MEMLDQNRISRCLDLLKENYVESSIITKVVETLDFDEVQHQNLDFLKLGIWTYVPKEWFIRTDVIPDLVFTEFGRDIAIGEEKYLIENILNKGTRHKTLLEANYQNVTEAIREMGNLSDLIVFAPINYFVKMHIDWAKEANAMVVQGNELNIGSNRIPLFWSSKYVNFNDFIIVRRSFGRWIVKPSISERLSVQMVESSERQNQMELKAHTVFHLDILDPSQILILKPP
jgi:hypothetical protein